jgi:hypothetical protein
LLPGRSGCLVLVIRLDAQNDATNLTPAMLDPARAQALLAECWATNALRLNRKPAAERASVSGYLPLALRIAASANRPCGQQRASPSALPSCPPATRSTP